MFKNVKGSHAYKVLEYGEAMNGVNDHRSLEEAKLQPLTDLGDHFDLLFDLLNIGSQRVLEQAWALLALLPTNQGLLERLKGCNGEMDWDAILPLDSTMRLLYSMQVHVYIYIGLYLLPSSTRCRYTCIYI